MQSSGNTILPFGALRLERALGFLGRVLLLCGLFAGLADRCRASDPITEFGLPSGGANPQTIIFGADNFYWMVGFETDQIMHITASNHSITAYTTPTGSSHPYGLVSMGTNIWFTENLANRIGLFFTNTPVGKGNHTFIEFPIHNPTNNSKLPCGPAGMTLGPDTNLWFVESQTNKVGVFSPVTTNLIAEYNVPFVQNFRQFYNIVAGPDGNLWFTDSGAGRILAINPTNSLGSSNGMVAVFPLATNSQPLAIIVGPDNAIWFTEFNGCKIGRLTTDCFNPASFTTNILSPSTNINLAALTEFPVQTNNINSVAKTNVQPFGLTVVTNGTIGTNIWFTEYAGAAIDRIDATGSIVTNGTNVSISFTLPPVGSSNSIVTTNGTNIMLYTRFPTPSITARPAYLVSGSVDTNIWFGDPGNNGLGKLLLDHSLNLNVTNITIIGTNFSGILATFTDNPTNGFPTNYSAIINWGDGSTNNFAPPTNSLLNFSTNKTLGAINVNASHTYPGFGAFPVSLTISNMGTNYSTGGATGTASFTITAGGVPDPAIKLPGNGKAVLSWTNLTTNVLQLQMNTNLETTNWVNVTNVPHAGSNFLFTITNNVSGRAFYRLKRE